jgi:hypothetical protein
MCGAHEMLLSRRRRRELRRDLELDKSSKTGKKTGNAPFNWSRDGNRTTYTKIPFLSLKEAHGQCERDFVSRIQFSRPTSRFFSNQCLVQTSRIIEGLRCQDVVQWLSQREKDHKSIRGQVVKKENHIEEAE